MMLLPLFKKAWRDHLKGSIGWLIGVVGITVLQLAVYPSIRDSRESWGEAINQFPDAFQKIFRMSDYTSEVGYLSTELFALTMPLLFIGMGVSWGSRATADDEELGTADVLLSMPISRQSVVATQILAMTSSLVALASALYLTLLAGSAVLDLTVPILRYVESCLVMILIGLVFGLGALLFGVVTGHKIAALGYSIGAAIVLFVLYSLAPLVAAINSLLRFNPLQWTIGSQPLSYGLDFAYTALTLGLCFVLSVLGVLVYMHRDIPA